MKYFVIINLFILTFISCKNHDTNYNDLVLNTIRINKIKTPILIHKTENNEALQDNVFFNLLSTKDLLSQKDENFYSVIITKKNNEIQIALINYKNGIDYITTFDNKTSKILSAKSIKTKRGESKPYFIYWTIMKEKFPNYMNWKNFKIPNDSLK